MTKRICTFQVHENNYHNLIPDEAKILFINFWEERCVKVYAEVPLKCNGRFKELRIMKTGMLAPDLFEYVGSTKVNRYEIGCGERDDVFHIYLSIHSKENISLHNKTVII